MATQSCLLEIKNRYQQLTPAEKRIADYILKNSEAVVMMSIQDLAQEAGTVKSAVVRCCKSLGFSGYSELKIVLAADISKNVQLNYVPHIAPSDRVDTILKKVFSANVKTLHDTVTHIDCKILSQLVEAMATARCIHIYGSGTSAALGRDLQFRLLQAGYTAYSFNDDTMDVSMMNIRPGDVALVISYSGQTASNLRTVSAAKEKGAITACITGHPNSPIVKLCDYPVVMVSAGLDYPMEPISIRIADISVIDVIAIALASRRYDEIVSKT